MRARLTACAWDARLGNALALTLAALWGGPKVPLRGKGGGKGGERMGTDDESFGSVGVIRREGVEGVLRVHSYPWARRLGKR